MNITLRIIVVVGASLMLSGFEACKSHKETEKTNQTTTTPTAPTLPATVAKTDTLNVKKFGVKGDGKTDDASAIQAVFRSAKAGQVVFFPAGTYMIGEAVRIQSPDIDILGEGTKSVLKFNNGLDLYTKYGKRTGMFNVMANNITIKNLYFDQNFRESGRSDGENAKAGCILVGGAAFGKAVKVNGLTIEKCTFYDYYGDAVSGFHAHMSNTIIRGNSFISSFIAGKWTTAGVHGEQAINFATADNALVENNDIKGALDDAIVTHTNSTNVIFRGNTITTTGGRILMNGTKGGIIENNTIYYIESGACAIMVSYNFQGDKLELNDGIVVRNNKIYINEGVHVTQAIRLNGAGNNILVENNLVEFKGTPSVGIEYGDRRAAKLGVFAAGKGIEIKGNTIRNAEVGVQESIVKTKYEGVVIEGNTIENAEIGVNAQPTSVKSNNYKNVPTKQKNIPMRERKVTKAQPNNEEDDNN